MSAFLKRFTPGTILFLFLVLGPFFLSGRGNSVKADTREVYENIEIFTEVLREIEKNYVEPQEAQKLIYGAIKGMVTSLDPHSSFMTKEEYQELMMETKGSFSGIGIEITIRDSVLTVVSPIEGTPAYEVGLKAGDRIIKVEDDTTKDMSLMEAVKKIRGPKGTEVKLTILREGALEPIEFSITRDVIPLKSVRYLMLAPEMAYIRISNFQSKTAKDLYSSLNELETENNVKGLILDLRNNPGGLLSQAIEVSDFFLDYGTIVSTKGRKQAQDIEAKARTNSKTRTYPIIVLINGGSASAAEIVAGALQDNKRALVLGTKSFGKGSVQTILPLSDGSGIRLTTARYYTPSGKSIQASGITPDIDLAFVPPSEKKENNTLQFLREKDLKGHMTQEEETGAEQTKEQTEKSKQAKELLERDNQVRHALQLLKSWTIFSSMTDTP